jgi:hypothetical protein
MPQRIAGTETALVRGSTFSLSLPKQRKGGLSAR